jgi:protoporphyrin/coproporphyrin ferrochelatase
MNRDTSSLGILLLQLGTPDDASVPAVRRYLREFLSDRRVIEAPRIIWWPVLHFSILRKRPAQSAEKYRRIWDPKTGMPLLHITERQVEELRKVLPGNVSIRFAMRYGRPSTPSVVDELLKQGVERLVVLPMYPQCSGTTTGSALDALFRALMKRRAMPGLRIIAPYFAHSAYIDAMAGLIRGELGKLAWQPDHFVLSFHGIPVKYVERGDPYPRHCEATAQLIASALDWRQEQWSLTYQSILGRDPWLQPYTEETLRQLARQGKRKVLIATPGFTTDCLETIDEVGREAREAFQHAGGEQFHRCPCLNDHPLWIEGMRRLIAEEAGFQSN